MRAVDLPSPGNLSNGIKIRTEAAKAISAVEVTASKTPGGKIDTAGRLAAFFSAAAAALSGLYETDAPSVSSRVIAEDTPNRIDVTFAEDMDVGVVPAAEDFALAGADVGDLDIVSLDFISPKVLAVYLSGNASVGDTLTLAYTQPSVNALRDSSANKLASFGATSITVNVTSDNDEPEVDTLEIENAAPGKIVVTFDETMADDEAPPKEAFSITSDGDSTAVTGVAWASDTELELTLDEPAVNGDVLTLSYNATAAGATALADEAGNKLASFEDEAVTNSVEA